MESLEGRLPAPSGHKVCTAPKQPWKSKVTGFLKQTLMMQDHLVEPPHQSKTQQCLRGLLHCLFPVLKWAPYYKLPQLKADIIAGLTIASLAIPQGISYAKLAGLPPIIGLYSSFVPPLIYAMMGTSKDVAVGPVSLVSLLMRGFLLPAASDPSLHLKLAFTATFFAGVFQASLGFFRLGFLLDFLAHSTIVGFTGAAAAIVILQQLKGMLGIRHFTNKMDLPSVLRSTFTTFHEWNWQTASIGFGFLLALLIARRISKRRKELFWIGAIAPLTAVIISTLLVFLTRADKGGVDIIGRLSKGLNPPSSGKLLFDSQHFFMVLKTGIICGLVALTEAMAIGRTMATLNDYQIDGNREMLAIGLMNIVGSCTSCYITTGSISRTAVNNSAGCKTAASNVVMSIVVMVTLLLLMPLFHFTPAPVLAAVIIAAVLNLIDIPAMCAIWRVDKVDFLALLTAFLGVLFISPPIGLLLSAAVSTIRMIVQVTRPSTPILGRLPGTNIYRNVEQYADAQTMHAFLVVRIDAPVCFSNANYVREAIQRQIGVKERVNNSQLGHLQYVILDLTMAPNVDITGVHMLQDLHRCLQKKNLQMILVNPNSSVVKKLEAAGLVTQVGQEWMFVAVGDAIAKCLNIPPERNHVVEVETPHVTRAMIT